MEPILKYLNRSIVKEDQWGNMLRTNVGKLVENINGSYRIPLGIYYFILHYLREIRNDKFHNHISSFNLSTIIREHI